MDTLDTMRVFVRVAQLGTFAAAARDLRMSPASVTKHVAALEARLCTRLLERTTRRVSLTESGLTYLEQCQEALQAVDDADASVVDLMHAPRGRLRVAAAIDFGQHQLADLLASFVHEHPEVTVDLRLSNRPPDLVQDNIDVSLRWSQQPLDGSFVARPLARARIGLWAAPGYLRRHGIPHHPDELGSHRFVVFSEPVIRDEFRFVRGGEEVRGRLAHRMLTNSGELLVRLVSEEVGLAVVPSFLARAAHDEGRIRPVLTDWSLGDMHLYAVYPHRRYLPPKVRVFVELLTSAWGDPALDPWWPELEGEARTEP